MKNLKFAGIIAFITVIGFSFAACGDDDNGGGGGPQKVTYVSMDDNGNTYTLEIDESGARSARSAAQAGDTFKLTVEYSTVVGGGDLKMTFEYSGTVGAAQVSGATVSLTLNINGETITITIVGTQMTIIIGKIVDDEGKEIVEDPGDLTPVDPAHTHTYGTTWSYNTTQHWRECTANDGAKTAVANHTGTPCTVCGYSSSSGGDPTTWTAVSNSTFGTSYPSNNILDVAYGNNTWVAVGRAGKMAYSTDGASWTAVSNSTFGNDQIDAVAFDNNIFIAVGHNSRMASSTDGKTWTAGTIPFSYANAIAYGGGRWVIVGVPGRTAYSTDGRTWTTVSAQNVFGSSLSPGSSGVFGVAYGNNRFVITGDGGKMAYSSNGESWTAVANSTFPSGNQSYSINSIVYANNRFVAVGGYGIAYSSDGASWTRATGITSGNGIAFGNNRYVVVGNSGKIGYSTNGAAWTTVGSTGFGTTAINAVAYGNGRFVAVGNSGKMAYADW